MPAAEVFAVVVVDVRVCQAFDGLTYLLIALAEEQVEVVGHEAICVVRAVLSGGKALVVVADAEPLHALHEVLIIFRVLEDYLVVDAAHHHVVDAGGGGMSRCSWHRGVIRFSLLRCKGSKKNAYLQINCVKFVVKSVFLHKNLAYVRIFL